MAAYEYSIIIRTVYEGGYMDRVRKMLGCDLPQISPFTGKGIFAAVLDSGVAMHPDLRGRIVEFRDFTEKDHDTERAGMGTGIRMGNRSLITRRSPLDNCYDDNGHGTHIAGILCGNGKMSKGRYKGIAPECKLICAKVLDRQGGGSLGSLISAIDWIIELNSRYPIRIVNISIEMGSDEEKTEEDRERSRREMDILRQKIGQLWLKNMIIIVAAGNKGPAPRSLSPISEFGSCVCVACHDGDTNLPDNVKPCSTYSGRGPAKEARVENLPDGTSFFSNPLRKPDIVAPGTGIISCGHKYMNAPYVSKSGTSMAAPLVSGACALYLQKYPDASNARLRRQLQKTAGDLGESWSIQGAGMLRIDRLLGE